MRDNSLLVAAAGRAMSFMLKQHAATPMAAIDMQRLANRVFSDLSSQIMGSVTEIHTQELEQTFPKPLRDTRRIRNSVLPPDGASLHGWFRRLGNYVIFPTNDSRMEPRQRAHSLRRPATLLQTD